MHSSSKLLKVSLVLIVVLAGCNLARATQLPATGPAAATTAPVAGTTGSVFSVQISSPAANAQLPGGTPVQVAFSAAGGPFIEFDLKVDGAIVTTQTATGSDAQVSGTLAWAAPTEGAHTLMVMALDANKNETSASVQVTVGKGGAPGATEPATQAAPASGSTSGLQLKFLDLADGGSVTASMVKSTTDSATRPEVILRVQATGGTALGITLRANGQIALDASQHSTDVNNMTGVSPFVAEIHWSPVNGAGAYTLVASATDENKQVISTTIHVTVTGIPAFTPTPPPLTEAQARVRFSQLYKQLYNVDIPDPSMQRFDAPEMPSRARWISSVYYEGHRYYIELFDDTHYNLSPSEYADPQHPSSQTYFVLCKPAGLYKILVAYVDYGNLTVDKADALAQVPAFANWTNQLYDDFARSQGFSSSPLHLQAEGAWFATPPSPGNPLTAAELRAAGIDPTKYNFVIEIDVDRDNLVGKTHWKGILESGGGLALQGCGAYYDDNINIFSMVQSPDQTQQELHGVLSMDLNHELSHLFGMLDSWVFKPSAITAPDGAVHDDWIPYTTFGWMDTDGDGIPEIIDPTPYGTSGPQP